MEIFNLLRLETAETLKGYGCQPSIFQMFCTCFLFKYLLSSAEIVKSIDNILTLAGIVQHVIEKLILPALKKADIPILNVTHAGSQCEYSALPGSDFDLQFPINMTNVSPKPSAVNLEGVRGWQVIRGGPSHLLNGQGYLSNEVVRSVPFESGSESEKINKVRAPPRALFCKNMIWKMSKTLSTVSPNSQMPYRTSNSESFT